MRDLPTIEYNHRRHDLTINGVRFSSQVLDTLTKPSGDWSGPFWIRRQNDVVIFNTIDPATPEPAHV